MENSTHDFSGKKIREDVKHILNKYRDSIDKLVTFGSKLLDWDLNREGVEKKDGYLVPILFLRNLIENIDAMGVLIHCGASDPSKSLLRTVLENFYSLEYLLGEKQHERSMSFHVWNTYHNAKYLEKLDGTSQRAKELQATFKKDEFLKHTSPLIFDQVEKLKANANDLLALNQYKEFAAEYNRTKKKIGKAFFWYSLYDGPRDVVGLANASKYPALYEVYRGLSNSVHGTDIIQGKLTGMDNGQVGILQLRFPKEAHSMTQYAHNLCIAAFDTYVNARLPERKRDFQNWLLSIQEFRKEMVKGDPINFV